MPQLNLGFEQRFSNGAYSSYTKWQRNDTVNAGNYTVARPPAAIFGAEELWGQAQQRLGVWRTLKSLPAPHLVQFHERQSEGR